MDITVRGKGDYDKTRNWLKNIKEKNFLKTLEKYGSTGVQALADATPKRTGKTAASWYYTIEWEKGKYTLTWKNSNMSEYNIPIVLLINYGHATKNGSYINGIEFIDPALEPIFKHFANEAYKEVITW